MEPLHARAPFPFLCISRHGGMSIRRFQDVCWNSFFAFFPPPVQVGVRTVFFPSRHCWHFTPCHRRGGRGRRVPSRLLLLGERGDPIIKGDQETAAEEAESIPRRDIHHPVRFFWRFPILYTRNRAIEIPVSKHRDVAIIGAQNALSRSSLENVHWKQWVIF